MFVLLLGKKNSLLFLVLLEFWLKCICVCYRFAKNAVIIAEGVEATRIFQVALFVRSLVIVHRVFITHCLRVCFFFVCFFCSLFIPHRLDAVSVVPRRAASDSAR